MDERLVQFARNARGKGMDFATLRALLLSAGWKEKQVAEVVCAQELGMEVPEPRGASTARDAFLHALSFAALYTWVISVVVLYFTYVNLAWPDPAWEQGDAFARSTRSTIRWSLASVFVAFPLFVVLWRMLLREMASHPEKAKGAARRWLTYFSLFVGAVTLVSDVITLVYFLFEGELTLRFVLKVTLLFAITGATFVYLMLTTRTAPEATT